MNSLIFNFIAISAAIVFVMSMLSVFIHMQERSSLSRHMMEVWFSYLTYFLISFLTQGPHEGIVALATLGWIWRVRAFRLILEDISLTSLHQPWHHVVLASGFVLGFIGHFLGYSFTAYTLPACMGVSIVGFAHILDCYKVIQFRPVSRIYYVFLFNVFFVFLHILNYPFMRTNPDMAIYGFGVALFTTFLTAVLLPSVLLSEQSRTHALHLETLVEERTQQLINQSKFSALGEMAAGLAHEINNPLAVISGKAGQLKRSINSPNFEIDKISAGLENIENTAFRISRIIKGLKDFSRNSDHTPKQNTQLSTIINETLDLCRERFNHHGVELRVGLIPDISVYCRNVQISQVLLNVLNNAFDAVVDTQEKWVKLDIENHDNKLVIRILDSGPGVKTEIRNKIMMPFFTTKDVGKGTGLGLSISKGIIEDHQGAFYLDPHHERTCFVVELPK